MSEPVVVALIGAGGAVLAAVVAAVLARGRTPRPAPSLVGNTAKDKPMSPADLLFQRLLGERRKISYIDAYEILVGPRPASGKWRNQVHCPQVIAVAKQSATQVVQGLAVQLDALIVNAEGTQEPSNGYFKNRQFTREQWQQVFGSWPLA